MTMTPSPEPRAEACCSAASSGPAPSSGPGQRPGSRTSSEASEPADGSGTPTEAEVAPSTEVPEPADGSGASTMAETDEDRRWRRVLWSLPSGLYIVGSRAGQRRNLMTASWVVQVASSPRQVGVSIEQASVTLDLVRTGGVFALSLLPVDQRALVRRFAKPVPPGEVHVDEEGAGTMAGVRVLSGASGAPFLAVAIGVIDCQVAHIVDLGSHCFVVGRVVGIKGGGGGPDPGAASPMRILAMGDTRMHYGG